MSSLRNSVQLIGHLGADPEIKNLESGAKVGRIRIATTDRYKTASGEWKDDTQWHNVSGWAGVAEQMEKYLKKGSHVVIQGKLVHNEYVDAQGVKKYFTEVKANTIMMLDKRQHDEANGQDIGAVAMNDSESDGLPF